MSRLPPIEEARRRLASAAQALADFQQEAGVQAEQESTSTPWRLAADSNVRLALEAAQQHVRALEEQLAQSRREVGAAAEQNRLLSESVARGAGEAEVVNALRKRAEDAETRAVSMTQKAALLEAETVRLESLRRRAERATADIDARSREIEGALRGEIRNLNSALDRKAAEAGALESRLNGEIDAMRARLSSAMSRLQDFEREKRHDVPIGVGSSSAAQQELQLALSVAAALRQEVTAIRLAAEQREIQLNRELVAARLLAEKNAAAAAAPPPPPPPPPLPVIQAPAPVFAPVPEPVIPPPLPEMEWDATATVGDAAQEIERPGFIAPSIEPLLDPGWSRLLRLVRPPIEAAYAQLRRLSTTALTPGQKTLLKMAAASIAGASDSLSSIELVLEDGPAPATSSATPVLEAALAAWEPAFRRRGVGLHREWSSPIPEAAHDPKALRIIIHHVLRNVLEAVNRGGRLTVRAGRGADGALNIEFLDDGPGFPAPWLERRFEPFAAPRRGRAGLGLSLVRRTLRRWGGEAEAGNVASGHGARLILMFAPPPAPSPTTAR